VFLKVLEIIKITIHPIVTALVVGWIMKMWVSYGTEELAPWAAFFTGYLGSGIGVLGLYLVLAIASAHRISTYLVIGTLGVVLGSAVLVTIHLGVDTVIGENLDLGSLFAGLFLAMLLLGPIAWFFVGAIFFVPELLIEKLSKQNGASSSGVEKRPIHGLASDLLSNNDSTYDAAVHQVFEYSRAGNRKGINALETAIRQKCKGVEISFHKPGLAAYDSWDDNSPEEILRLARQHRLWQIPGREVQQLLSRAQGFGAEVRDIWMQAREQGAAQGQIRAIQLYGLHLACQVLLTKV